MTLRFGTDGVRGVANVDLTPELVVALGRAAARVLAPSQVIVGRDTRRSGPLLQAAFAAGVAAEGVDVVSLGVVPTPVVSFAASATGAAGAMISASHNAYADNGIKLFAPGGRKLMDDDEQRLEAELDALLASHAPVAPAVGAEVGVLLEEPEHLLAYADAVVESVEGGSLRGLTIVVDCANGAATTIAPHVLRRLGAEVVVVHADPDGTNINAGCGSTHPDDLQRLVVKMGADAGLAFDGDADRVLAVDAAGQLVDGDQIIAIVAVDRHERGVLRDDTVVVTVMSNLGFRQAMDAHGIAVVETAVGDRNVLDALDDGGLSLGGEQSGHVIFRDLAITGDGLLTGVQLLDVVARSKRTLHDLASVMTRLPQVLLNVKVAVKGLDVSELIAEDVAAAERELDGTGRVLVRPSGTEPLVRVMVEAPSAEQADAIAHRLATAIGNHAAAK